MNENDTTWFCLYQLALFAEAKGDITTAERLERLALISAFNSGWFDSLLPEDYLTPSKLREKTINL
ncbi:hypothetical protein, partial [Enterococcus faecalis]|uniref:hypothetical protein n=1 Tax=Enterococcus faecalis TaxID=1351 RepID=UPI00403FAC5B